MYLSVSGKGTPCRCKCRSLTNRASPILLSFGGSPLIANRLKSTKRVSSNSHTKPNLTGGQCLAQCLVILRQIVGRKLMVLIKDTGSGQRLLTQQQGN